MTRRRINEKPGKFPRVFRKKSQQVELSKQNLLKWANYFAEIATKANYYTCLTSDSGPDFAILRDSTLDNSNCWLLHEPNNVIDVRFCLAGRAPEHNALPPL